MATVPAIEPFRTGPVGLWVTIETLPCGEAVQFSSAGLGTHRSYSGLACDETHFEWQPAGDFCIRVRFLNAPSPASQEEEQAAAEAGDTGAGGWELVRYSVIESPHPYGGRQLHLRTMFGPLFALDELWYQGPLAARPVSGPRSEAALNRDHPLPAHPVVTLVAFAAVLLGGLVGLLLVLGSR
jgi:hypothetical protein